MTKRDEHVSLKDMLIHAQEAADIMGSLSREELAHDRLRQLALTRLVEIIGEAANRVSASTQRKYSSIPWSEIIGMRHRLIHGYDIIDHDLLWNTIAHDLPSLIDQLKAILSEK